MKWVGGAISKLDPPATVLPSSRAFRSKRFFWVFAVFSSLDGITASVFRHNAAPSPPTRWTAGFLFRSDFLGRLLLALGDERIEQSEEGNAGRAVL
jgi:hypothetical protein